MSEAGVPPGVPLPTMRPMNGSTQRMAAINNQQDATRSQSNLINAMSGGKYGGKHGGKYGGKYGRKYKGGFVYPQNTTLYKETGGNSQTTVAVTNKLAVVQSQNHANGVFDSAAQSGGRRRRTRTRTRTHRRSHRRARTHRRSQRSRSRRRHRA